MTRQATTRIIAVMNQTKDVGKTTITTNLGVIMAEMGYSVLLLDMDPQADLSRQFAVPDVTPGMDRLLRQDTFAETDILSLNERLSLIPAGAELIGFEQQHPTRELGLKLKQLLTSKSVADRDIILIDCAAISGLLGTNAVLAATDMLIPVSANQQALHGMINMLPVLRRVANLRSPPLRLWLCLNRLPDNTDFAKQFITVLSEYFPQRVLKTVIYDSESVNPADYLALAKDLLMGRVN